MRDILKICIFGPESTGKSTLAENLARHYKTSFVPEYAKDLIAQQDGKVELADIPRIARGQMESEDAAFAAANRLLICDTDLITTTIWSDWLFGACPDWIRAEADRRRYDLYILTDIDVPWVPDIHRNAPTDREKFLIRCQEELDNRNINYVKIKGSWEQRFNTACAAVNALLRQAGHAALVGD